MEFITIHCSATKPKYEFSVSDLRHAHVAVNKWSDIGYHFYITVDGAVTPCRTLSRNGAHVKGHNSGNIGICLEGGLNNDTGKPDDTFNYIQREALRYLIIEMQDKYGIENAAVKGHRDWYGDRKDWLKVCPCFDVAKFIKEFK